MFNTPLPTDTAQLLRHLRMLPPDDPQDLLTAYTQSLAHLRDDVSSLHIFMDYVRIASAHCEVEEIEHIYSLMKVKLRTHRTYWLGYIRFEVERRAKPFDVVFAKMMDYLRVKVFPGKEELVSSMTAEREVLSVVYGSNTNRREDGTASDDPVGDTPLDSRTADLSISFLSKRLKDLSSPTETFSLNNAGGEGFRVGRSALDTKAVAQMDDFLQIKGAEETSSAGADKENDGNRRQARGAYELDLLNTTGNEKSGRLRFSPNRVDRREPYRPAHPTGAKSAHGSLNENTQSTNCTDSGLECELLEATQTFKEPLKNIQVSTVSFKNKDVVRISRIGKGGYSAVYKILMDNEIYALKQIRIDDKESIRICMDEISLLQRLNNCAFVIKMVDHEITKDTVNIVLEYGETDLQKLISSGSLNAFYIKYVWESILHILVFIHSNRIVHRDIKPANFVLVRGRVKLIDFGISKSIKADTTSVLNIEKAGTLNYISPEQCTGRRVSRAADIWAAGCILYYMVYNRHVHPSKGVMDVIRHMSEERPIEYGPGAPLAVESMRLCLQYDPKKRAKPSDLLSHPFLHTEK